MWPGQPELFTLWPAIAQVCPRLSPGGLEPPLFGSSLYTQFSAHSRCTVQQVEMTKGESCVKPVSPLPGRKARGLRLCCSAVQGPAASETATPLGHSCRPSLYRPRQRSPARWSWALPSGAIFTFKIKAVLWP